MAAANQKQDEEEEDEWEEEEVVVDAALCLAITCTFEIFKNSTSTEDESTEECVSEVSQSVSAALYFSASGLFNVAAAKWLIHVS